MGAKTTKEIAEWVCKTKYDDFGSEVVDYAKKLALSHLGMNVAGSTMSFGKIAMQYVKDYSCSAEAGVVGGGFRTLAEYATVANGATSHTTELEDDSFPDGLYSCGAWPAALAFAEKMKLSGKDVIEALVIGYEVAARLAMAAPKAIAKGWVAPAPLAIGTAVMVAKMLDFNVDQTISAMSFAASQATGIARQTGSGPHLIEAGFHGRDGICAAMLAKLGGVGNPTILEGPGGWMHLWGDAPDFDLPLGEELRIMDVGIKKYPCCYLQQRNIDGVIDLIAEHNISWEDVESVEHEINYTASLYLKYDQPETTDDARFSLPHSTVAAFFEKEVFLPSFTDEKARDPRYIEARKKVKVTVHPEWPGDLIRGWNSPIAIRMKDGAEHKKICINARGDPALRLGSDAVMKKYIDCMDFAGIFSREKAERAAELILTLDKIKDITEIMDILTFPDKLK